VTTPAFLGLAALSFVLMEPLTYAVHRWVMHGPGGSLHRSHHHPTTGRVEANDLFPAMFASVAGGALVVGFNIAGYAWLVPIGTGVTLYGVAYGIVHDGAIHGRLPAARRLSGRYVQWLADSHRLHHRFGGEPYGMLAPFAGRVRGGAEPQPPQDPDPPRGSAPSQVPTLP
jgi:beta-carotene 3-hydroxylase